MKRADFVAAINSIPQYKAKFVVKKVPRWLSSRYGVEKGEVFTCSLTISNGSHAGDLLRREKDGLYVSLGSSFLTFVGYEKI